VPEIHTASVRFPKLNAALLKGIRRCHASTRESSASVTAPASGPKRRTAVNAKTSDTVNRASRPGITNVIRPLMKVSAAKNHHSTGRPSPAMRLTQNANRHTPTADTAPM
jgi:hypothetical protein